MKKADASGKPSIFLLTPLREGRRASSQMRTNICGFLLTPLREGRPDASLAPELFTRLFLLTPLREGRHDLQSRITTMNRISTHAPAGGATRYGANSADSWFLFLLTPLREGRPKMAVTIADEEGFLLTPLREGRRSADQPWISHRSFLLTPLREGRPVKTVFIRVLVNFYSRPCGRGDHCWSSLCEQKELYFYSRPCGRGDNTRITGWPMRPLFLLTPLREGRLSVIWTHEPVALFLLTPLREGRQDADSRSAPLTVFLLTPLREGRPMRIS